ncbi:nitrate reductase [Neptuniibacter caesariensis]|uniref:Molybdopterin oxidoreductase n=1 Tax=Neptuniibacter caesariensis TaxID=207954 RepID=A0A7U8C7Y4_NEPCE|nr:nitrate reductase [Neptuniibacter caesariensis]EAR61869.1 Molybdopterin oxidoreductase [Oceanospirillum sp. MED92] [Neptuniibacter caesariensis]
MHKLTTCPYCGVGCGVDAELGEGVVAKVQGDKEHPSNYGRLCVKGSSLHEVLGTNGRLLSPLVDGQRVSWADALDRVAEELLCTIKEHGPDSVAFYLSGQLLTEDYYVANKLIKGFIGTANVDTNSRLCMSSAVAGYKRAFGSDTVPCCYDDLEQTDLLVLVGSNTAWNHPILFQRMQAAKRKNPDLKVVVVDPRRTATCDLADLHLAIKPGTDSELFSGLLSYISSEDLVNRAYVTQFTEGFNEAISAASEQFNSRAELAEYCGIDLATLEQFYQLFSATDKVISFYSQGVNQSSSGTDNSNAIINCHLATGRIGYPGAGPFSITGQPNAMGGREVGGLANQLAAHMDFSSAEAIDRVGRFWDAPNIAQANGLTAVNLFQAVEKGEIKAVWVMGTNPAVSLPNTNQVSRALEECPLVVVSDCMASTETIRYADICLPATGWSEKNGTVTNAERRISRQRGLLPPSGEAKHDWWIISEVAKRMGYAEAFDYQHPYQIFAEHAELSGFENDGKRDFDISLFSDITETAYDALKPVQWPVTNDAPYGTARMFADGRFYTPSGKARFIPVTANKPKQLPTPELPYVMNTGRLRDQWHTMAMTGRTSRLFSHRDEPFVELCQADAQKEGIVEGELVKLSHPQGEYIGRARITDDQRPGELFVPMHWNGEFSAKARMGVLLEPVTDPISGQPESKHGRVAIEALNPKWQGWFICQAEMKPDFPVTYWTRVPKKETEFYYLADTAELDDPLQWCRDKFGEVDIWLEDKAEQSFRAAGLQGEKLQWAFFIMPYGQIPSTGWLEEMFAETELSLDQRRFLLSVTGCEIEDPGSIICSCYQVGSNAIEDAISQGCCSAEALGEKLKCGTNCGSCIPELNALIAK